MTDLTQAGSNNPGGVLAIRFAPVAGIVTLPLPATAGPTSSPTFATGIRWFSCYGTEGTKSVSEEEKPTDNGPVWTVSIAAFLPGDAAALRQQLSELANHRFVLEVEDNQGLSKRYGTKVENFELSYSFTTGSAMGDRRGAKLLFSGTLTAPAPAVSY